MRLVDNSELIVPRERERLMAFQQREAAGGRDTTFSGPHSSGKKTPDEWATRELKPLEEAELEREVERALPEELQIEDPTLHSHDTVGAVALDKFGNLAAGTSTGGTLNKAPGRVGDSSLIGCGCYADNESAAVSLTGWGEPIMKLVLGKWAVDRVAVGASPEQAASDAIAYLFARLGGHGGIILLGPDGRLGIAHNTPRMAWGIAEESGMQVGITRN
jgi:beta-aspartyl-peptidase (threonine type)